MLSVRTKIELMINWILNCKLTITGWSTWWGEKKGLEIYHNSNRNQKKYQTKKIITFDCDEGSNGGGIAISDK